MSVNKNVDEKELEKVSGGFYGQEYPTISCVSCGYCGDSYEFHIECIDEGCTHYKRYTCPKCGHVWTIEL